jgi:endonuclease/exonuclease/phosphatase (EEP) superfamily protein YafD
MSLDPTPVDPAAPVAAAPRTRRERFVQAAVWFGWLSAILHFWPKDRWAGLSLWFYGTPWGVILFVGVFTTLGSLLLRRRLRSLRTLYASFALLLLAGGMWLASDWNWRRPQASMSDGANAEVSQSIRLLVWNISRGRHGWQNIADDIRRYDPDVICLVEAGPYSDRMRGMWEEFFPRHHVSMLGGSVVCIVRGSAGECTPIELTRNSRLRILPVEVRGRSFQCAIVDIESSIFKVRRRPLERLADSLEAVTGPILVAGDFNTPTDSVHFASLGEGFTSAWQEAGAGYSATWPVPLPLMDLDQVWRNDGIAIRSFTLGWSNASDHRPVIVEFVVTESRLSARPFRVDRFNFE